MLRAAERYSQGRHLRQPLLRPPPDAPDDATNSDADVTAIVSPTGTAKKARAVDQSSGVAEELTAAKKVREGMIVVPAQTGGKTDVELVRYLLSVFLQNTTSDNESKHLRPI